MNTLYSDKRCVKLTNALRSALLFVLVLTSQYAKATTTTGATANGHTTRFITLLLIRWATRAGATVQRPL